MTDAPTKQAHPARGTSRGTSDATLRWSQPPPSFAPPSTDKPQETRSHVIKSDGPVEPFFLATVEDEPQTTDDTSIDLTPFEADMPFVEREGTLYNTIVVHDSRSGRTIRVDAGDEVFHRGELVLSELDRGGRIVARVVQANQRVVLKGHIPRVLKRLEQTDNGTTSRQRQRELEVLAIAKHVARSLDMPIKIVSTKVESNGKTAVYFASEERVDFRDLFSRISGAAQGRIELRQIGVRDAARMIGGVGLCGQPLCCSRFLHEFAPVSIRMAKDQGLVLNPNRVSGLCGRLLCCLTYEQALYRKQRKLLPRIGKRVITPLGPGRVRDLDVLGQMARVSLENGESASFPPSELTPMFPSGGGGGPQDGKKGATRSRHQKETAQDSREPSGAGSRRGKKSPAKHRSDS